MESLQILHVDDDPALGERIRTDLDAEGMTVHWAETGSDGLALLATRPFDLIILDRMLPDMTGLDIIETLRRRGIQTPVLMLSALGLSSSRVEGLEAGADDYLAKPFETNELVARLHALHRRAQVNGQGATIVYGPLECHVKARTAFREGRHIPLSPREFDLFHFLMEHAGNVVTREMLLRSVWKLNFDPQTNVIDVNIGRLRRKLEEGFGSPVLETVWGSGYRLGSG